MHTPHPTIGANPHFHIQYTVTAARITRTVLALVQTQISAAATTAFFFSSDFSDHTRFRSSSVYTHNDPDNRDLSYSPFEVDMDTNNDSRNDGVASCDYQCFNYSVTFPDRFKPDMKKRYRIVFTVSVSVSVDERWAYVRERERERWK
jgi:hypothetical protein